jgi:glycosyltransferase involved in cell wall biosynthesis
MNRPDHGKPPLCVAMCTFNGAAHLQAQLESIATQSLPPDELLVCDDGSADGTIELVRRFAANAPFSVRILAGKDRLGVVRNFEKALEHCTAPYVALCDQDDVWEPGRLQAGMRAMREAEAAAAHPRPILVHSDMRVVDASDAALDDSYFRRRGFRPRHTRPLRELVLQNYVTGCSSLVNRPLLDLALPFPSGISIHDWWLALIAAAVGDVVTLDEQTVRYRLHGTNVIGAKRVEWRRYVHLDFARGLFRRALQDSRAAERRLRERGIRGPGLDFLEAYHRRAAAGGAGAALGLYTDGVRLQNALPTAIFYLHVLMGRLAVE